MHVDGLIATIESKLKHFVSEWPGNLREKIREVIMSAIRLDCELSQQSAYWYLGYLTADQLKCAVVAFDDACMKVPASHGPGQRVALMTCPALYKAGDSHGERYGQSEVASKSEVICFPPMLPPKDFELPPSVPQVVDAKTAIVRQQQYPRAHSQASEVSKTQKILELIGIKVPEYSTSG